MRTLLLPPRTFLAGVLLAVVLPGPVFAHWGLRLALAAPVLAVGVGLMAWAYGRYQAKDAEIRTFDTPRNLVTDGPFRYSRNPMYLAFMVMLTAAALAAGTPWAWLWVVGFTLLCALWYVPFEERAAAQAFGAPYLAWKRRTPRWLGWPSPTQARDGLSPRRPA